ncbi:MAG: hypothetical protein JW795_07055 [Chitinivibrionales bacterium]|nr:hypothetical protein [Chitinivibrionales bacterium]
MEQGTIHNEQQGSHKKEPIESATEPLGQNSNFSERIKNAIQNLDQSFVEKGDQSPIPFSVFLQRTIERPTIVIRNVFQVFHDMVMSYLGEGSDEYPDDPESIHYVRYNSDRLFVEGSGHPFFADRLFANRLVSLARALKRGAQQNKVYIFNGPPGCGKSTFLNNLLRKFEEYANTDEGIRYETIWRFNDELFVHEREDESKKFFEKLYNLIEKENSDAAFGSPKSMLHSLYEYLEIPCPSHDNPILLIPRAFRRSFLSDLFIGNEFKNKLFTEKEYGWVFRNEPCTICSSLYKVLLDKYRNHEKVFEMIFARPYYFNRRLGEGISVFNPGDEPLSEKILTNPYIQNKINALLNDSNKVKYLFSEYAKTNNGIYALMDIKSHNTNRIIKLHNIISEGIHKVEHLEENVKSLLLAVMNPEDQKNIEDFKSFSDRIRYIHIPYVLDMTTEVKIYRTIFGKHIDKKFLPHILDNFARVIISTRLNSDSKVMTEFVEDPSRYYLFCDRSLMLLKMEFYAGHIPDWLIEEDRKRFSAKQRRKIIADSESEGKHGISGRDSITLFNEFYSTYTKDDKFITMSDLTNFFAKSHEELKKLMPKDMLDALLRLYNYTVLHEVKESLYYYNKKQISRDIMNYLFAINFEIGSSQICTYTQDKIEITEEYLSGIEQRILGTKVSHERCLQFREETQKEYATQTLTQEILVENKKITQSKIYELLHERYVYNLKQKVLDPFLANENFRRAIKDFNDSEFKTYDRRIQLDILFLIRNLVRKFGYTELGAKELCIYVIDNELAKKFS